MSIENPQSACRRTFSTLIEGDLKDIQEPLGHSAATMTLEHYRKAIPERQRVAVEALDAALSAVRQGGDSESSFHAF